jgi:predicted kinase
MLIAFSGLPGTGKTTLAQSLARRVGATYLRIDTIEDELLSLGGAPMVDSGAGYLVAYKIAEENLGMGRVVVADAVNATVLTRNAWRQVALRASTGILEVHVVCSDATQHERRIRLRPPGSRGSSWSEVRDRQFELPCPNALVIDTAHGDLEEHAARVEQELTRGCKLA